jgi:hypothetical protein
MTAISIEYRSSSARARVAAPRPGVGSGRRAGPQAHPARALPAAFPGRGRTGPCACTPTEAGARAVGRWRLTDRGVAVVLVTGLMIMIAALTVVGLTALRVTGSDYRPAAGTLAQSR